MEGDLRLVDEVANGPWISGRPEIFFEGSWSQVCGLGFDGFDADVACRQLGFGPGTANTVERVETSLQVEFRGVNGSFAEVALTKVGCVGTEASLLECAGDDILDGIRTRECNEAGNPGLFLSCVADPIEGVGPYACAALLCAIVVHGVSDKMRDCFVELTACSSDARQKDPLPRRGTARLLATFTQGDYATLHSSWHLRVPSLI